jgi:hypothetical protein
MMELVAGLPADETPQVKETIVTEETAPEQKTISFKQIEAAAPQETKSSFMSGLDDLSTGDLLKMAGAFFTAGGQGSTGSMTNDALNFLGSAGVTAGDVMSKAQKRKLSAAEKAELLDLKKRQVRAQEREATAKEITARSGKLPKYKTPTTTDIDFATTSLEDFGFNASPAAVRQIALIQKSRPQLTHKEVVGALISQGILNVEEPGFFGNLIGRDAKIQMPGE